MKSYSKRVLAIVLSLVIAFSVSGISAVCTEKGSEDGAICSALPQNIKFDTASESEQKEGSYTLPSAFQDEQNTSVPAVISGGVTAAGRTFSSAEAYDAVSPAFTAGSRLTGLAKVFYDSYVEAANNISTGESQLAATNGYTEVLALLDEQSQNEFCFTAEELGFDKISEITKGIPTGNPNEYGLSGEYVDAYMLKATNLVDIACDKALHALLSDYPFELFWFKKTADDSQLAGGLNSKFEISIRATNYEVIGQDVYFTDLAGFELYIAFTFTVANDYYYSTVELDEDLTADVVDPSELSRATAAKANADAIIEKYKNYSDYDKLKAYHDEICKLTDYNNNAARLDADLYYGDPWQMVYVFDGDPDTTVVCEGYAKAFKYLCDNSSFTDKSLCCILASGTLYQNFSKLGDHMWNIVKMGGKNYLVDITNDDENSLTSLFLAEPMAGSADTQYLFKFTNSTYFGYEYASNQAEVFGKDRIIMAPEYQYGDINLSKSIDVCDCVKATVFASENNQLSILQRFLGDVDRDGNVDRDDAVLIAKYAAGLITVL